ncbi:MAG TPA: TetR family transcriptional regulator C-terminal domain-containing protein [Streptosporangiaceae bacterium]|jgi:AcrR family transcriptional regulator|nr:TetR family transcriptional regulator C-terminal domain-containing protein [Streptosporangiaceae bacterium]
MTDAAGATSALGTADHRREQMLRAALDVIADRGYADTRIADVAERTGISPALVIYYFKTKDQLLAEAIRFAEDGWYAEGQRRMTALPTAAARIEEIVAMTCLPEADTESHDSWLLWLDFWALAARSPQVSDLRQKADERWRELIVSLVRSGQEAGEFQAVDADDFAVLLSALLDGLAIQIALDDPVVGPQRSFDLSMAFIAAQLGFAWNGGRRARGGNGRGKASGNHREGA